MSRIMPNEMAVVLVWAKFVYLWQNIILVCIYFTGNMGTTKYCKEQDENYWLECESDSTN